jgi:predicted heme/steroid binding protein
VSDRLHRLIDEAVGQAQRRHRAELHRLLGLLEFEPPLAAEAVRAAVDEELDDQRRRALAEVAPLVARAETAAGARAAQAALDESAAAGGFPREALLASRAGAPAPLAATLEGVVARYDGFERRLGWLLNPTTADEVQRLDPVRDAQQIYHHISYDFRVEQKIFSILFELRGVGAPFASLIFHSTGEYTLRGFRRNNETFLIFSNLFEWGLDSKRGREMLARVNQIHGRYALHNEGFLYTLGGIMFVPELWNRKLGWRRFSEVERRGWFHAFAEVGRAMGIQGVSDDYDEMFRRWDQVSRDRFATSVVGRKVFDEVTVQMLATYPPELRAAFLSAFVAGMDDLFRDTLGLPPAPAEVVESLRAAFRLLGQSQAALPRVPWIRSLQLHPLYARPSALGVSARSPHLPARAGGADDASHPALPPLGDGAVTDGSFGGSSDRSSDGSSERSGLPAVTAAELARHDHDKDAWVAIDGFVYDVTRFIYEHPGGRAVLARQLGRDASQAFARVGHTAGAQISLLNFRVGRLAGAPAVAPPPPSSMPSPAPSANSTSPPPRVYNRRPSESRAWTAQDWHAMVDEFLHYAAAYQRAVATPGRDPSLFPIVLPHDLRGQAERPEAVVRPVGSAAGTRVQPLRVGQADLAGEPEAPQDPHQPE